MLLEEQYFLMLPESHKHISFLSQAWGNTFLYLTSCGSGTLIVHIDANNNVLYELGLQENISYYLMTAKDELAYIEQKNNMLVLLSLRHYNCRTISCTLTNDNFFHRRADVFMFFTKTSLLCVQTHSNLLLYYHKSNLSLAHHIEFPQSHEFRQGDHHSQLHEFQVDRSQAILYIYFLNDVFKGVLRKIDFFSLALKTDSYEFFDYRLLGDDIMYVPRESLKCRLLSNPTMNINTLQLQEGSLCFFKPEYESAYVEYVICFVMSTQTLVVFCGQMAIMKSHTAFTQLFFLDTYSKKLVADTKTDNMSLSVLDYDRFTFLQYDHKLSQLSIRIKQMIEPMTLTVFILTSLFEHFDDDLLRDAAEIIDYSP